jgi:hypothetical protein
MLQVLRGTIMHLIPLQCDGSCPRVGTFCPNPSPYSARLRTFSTLEFVLRAERTVFGPSSLSEHSYVRCQCFSSAQWLLIIRWSRIISHRRALRWYERF